MNDIITLSNSLYKLSKSEEFDLNINIPVVGTALKECLAINRKMQEESFTPIAFNENRLIFPHVTLKMGTVNQGCFETLLLKITKYLKKIMPLELSPLPIILKEPDSKYYFSEIYSEDLLAISRELNDLLGLEMKPARFSPSESNLHHITLGYKSADTNVIQSVLGTRIDRFVADRVQLSVMGKYGVCIGVLKTFYLTK